MAAAPAAKMLAETLSREPNPPDRALSGKGRSEWVRRMEPSAAARLCKPGCQDHRRQDHCRTTMSSVE